MKKFRTIVSLVLAVILLQTICVIPITAYQTDTQPSSTTPISACTITFSPTTYTGNANSPNALTVKDGNKTLTPYSDYIPSYSNNVNAGQATITITGRGDYSGSVDIPSTINPRSIAGNDFTITLSPTVLTYNGKAQEPSVTVKYNNKTLTKGTEYTVSYHNNVNVTTSEETYVTVKGEGNFTQTLLQENLLSKLLLQKKHLYQLVI